MTNLHETIITKLDFGQSMKIVKGRSNDCKMIFTESLDLRHGEVERNP